MIALAPTLPEGSQRKHEAVSVTEATRRHAKDRTTAIEARERELDEREVNVAIDQVNKQTETINAQHAENVAAIEAAQDANAAAKEANEAKAELLAAGVVVIWMSAGAAKHDATTAG